jgi:Ca2+/Na+ antiporter
MHDNCLYMPVTVLAINRVKKVRNCMLVCVCVIYIYVFKFCYKDKRK